MEPTSRIRLVVPSPEVPGRLLARPNGVSGWALPSLARLGAADAPWDDDATRRVATVLGVDADEIAGARHLGQDLWAITVTGRLPRVGNDWIGSDEVTRLGADAATVRAVAREWASGADPATS